MQRQIKSNVKDSMYTVSSFFPVLHVHSFTNYSITAIVVDHSLMRKCCEIFKECTQQTKVVTWAAKPPTRLGLCWRPVYLKSYHSRKQWQTIESLVSSMVGHVQFHCPQYHMVCYPFNSSTCEKAIQKSWLKYFWQLLYILINTGFRLLLWSHVLLLLFNIVPDSAVSATAGSKNHSNITKQYNQQSSINILAKEKLSFLQVSWKLKRGH